MKHLGEHHDNFAWAEVHAFKHGNSSSASARHARKIAKIIARTEKHSDRQKSLGADQSSS